MTRDGWQFADGSPRSPLASSHPKRQRKRNPFKSRSFSFLTLFVSMIGVMMIYRRREEIQENFRTMPNTSAASNNNRAWGEKGMMIDFGRTENKTIWRDGQDSHHNSQESQEQAHGKHGRDIDRSGVPEHFKTIRQDWRDIIEEFVESIPIEMFSARKIREEYKANSNNIQDTCMLVTILNGNVTFTEAYGRKRHSRASSVKYILSKIVKEKRKSLPGLIFLVMLTDGHKPRIPTFGSARHWNDWDMMIPVPLGNERGAQEKWGTPLEGWDAYIDRTIIETHSKYPWNSKEPKAVFRGTFTMQTYKLGSCNHENEGKCEPATKWSEVNRGVLYEVTKDRKDIFDVEFTKLKGKHQLPASQFDDVPDVVQSMPFQDFQKYKLILSIGSNQDWAERLRSLLFMNSAVVIHSAETQEFFTPALKEWVHYIPTQLRFEDLEKNVKWAIENDDFTEQLVRNQNAFADRYLSERSMQQYWEVLLEKFALLQARAAGEPAAQ